MEKDNPVIAIIGRENVGKSTLFNRLIEDHDALVSNIAGTTRDRNFGICLWRGKELTLVDTAGFDIKPDNSIKAGALTQVKKALEEADLILLVVDIQSGIISGDRELANLVQNLNKPYVLVANKADKAEYRNEVGIFKKLGLGDAIPVSAVNGSGTGDLLDIVIDTLPIRETMAKNLKKRQEETPVKITFLGQPNVGKSSIINAILNEERVIVSDLAHTTRETNIIPFKYKGKDFQLVDTAGIRKNIKKPTQLEGKSVERSIKALKQADIIVLVLEAHKEIYKQDIYLAGLAKAQHKGLILVVNKWDLIPGKEADTIYKIEKTLKPFFKFIKWAPMIFTSATKKIRVNKILDTAIEIKKQRNKKLNNKEAYDLLKQVMKQKPPPFLKNPKIKALEQIGVDPPAFLIVSKYKKWIHFSYLRYMENQIRKRHGFMGTAIKFIKRNLK